MILGGSVGFLDILGGLLAQSLHIVPELIGHTREMLVGIVQRVFDRCHLSLIGLRSIATILALRNPLRFEDFDSILEPHVFLREKVQLVLCLENIE